MKIIIFNYTHPQFPLVSAVRMREFSTSLARKGHQVILCTSVLNNTDLSVPLQKGFESALNSHNWDTPFFLSCTPLEYKILNKYRERKFNLFFNKILTFYYLIFKGGQFIDWQNSVETYFPLIRNNFSPDIIWTTFLNLNCWNLARRLSQYCQCPYVLDIKDPWDAFIPFMLRGILIRPFRKASAFTANSEQQGLMNRKWLNRPFLVVYSGINPTLFEEKEIINTSEFRITLIGSTYSEKILEQFIQGIELWVNQLENTFNKRNIFFCYAGTSSEVIERYTHNLKTLGCKISINSNLSLEEMLRLCKKSNINSYLWNIEGGFHHKLIELLACKNPVIVYPGEFPESTNIVKETNSILHICRTSNDIVENLNRIYYQYIDGHNNELQIDMSGYTWDSQTVKIEKIFKNIVNTEV